MGLPALGIAPTLRTLRSPSCVRPGGGENINSAAASCSADTGPRVGEEPVARGNKGLPLRVSVSVFLQNRLVKEFVSPARVGKKRPSLFLRVPVTFGGSMVF